MNVNERQAAEHYLLEQRPEYSTDNLLRKNGIDAEWLLLEAARLNLLEKMVELVDQYGADVNGYSIQPCGDIRSCPLYEASESGSIAALEWLLSRGADPNGRSELGDGDRWLDSITALWATAENGNVRVAQLLIQAGADVNAAKLSTNNTPLFMAILNGNRAMVTLLIRNKANLHKRNSSNETPMFIAVGSNRPDLVAQLRNAGATIPRERNIILDTMRSTHKSIVEGFNQSITDEEVGVLEELLDPNCNLQKDPIYLKARAAEMEGKYRDALRKYRLVDDSSGGRVQLKFDIERNFEAVFGVRGSDARISSWDQVPVMSEDQPKELQFYAWTQVGRKIFTHGGIDFITVQQFPSVDELWSFDIDTRKWSQLKTSGKTPGPRSGHTMFAYKNALYLWGGQSKGCLGASDSTLYRLDLNNSILSWEKIRTKTKLKPAPREDHAGVLYKGKYYMTGGYIDSENLADDLWCLDMSNYKWSALKRGPKQRRSHNMWAAHGKLYVLGGQTTDKSIVNPLQASSTIGNFDSYDIKTKVWTSVKVTGDQPFEISEFTVLPLYHGDVKDEPTSIIVWGGFTEKCLSKLNVEKEKRKYGDEFQDFYSMPYRKRMLRFDIDTQTWTLLKQTSEVLPKALSFAAEVMKENGKTKMIIGRGYGITPESTSEIDLENLDPKMVAQYKRWEAESGRIPSKTAKHSNNIYEVSIADDRAMCFANDNLLGKSWAWKFFDTPGEKRPSPCLFLSAVSSTLHHIADSTFEDFLKPPCDSVEPNNDSVMLGIRVKLHGLQGRKDLNGKVGRCGLWQIDKERYQIFIPPYENGGPAMLAVKPSNLLIANPLDEMDVQKLDALAGQKGQSATFPNVFMSVLVPDGNVKKQSLLNYIQKDFGVCQKGLRLITDTYHGPVSAKAQSILRSVASENSAFQSTLFHTLIPPGIQLGKASQTGKMHDQEQERRKASVFMNFYSKLKERDSLRVNLLETGLLRKKQGGSSINDLGSWLKIDVTLHGIKPKIRRELIVSPKISMQNLHHQVLCPVIGWASNLHCYAFRRNHHMVSINSADEINGDYSTEMKSAIDMMNEECWIGPRKSTAVDSMFQPLYIGGALANDKKIVLGELFMMDEKDEMNLQYVYDFGDWWSHSLLVTKFDGEVPNGISVAHILSGEGGCPPENVGGINNYVKAIKRLNGKEHVEADKNPCIKNFVDPTNELWWNLLNEAVCGQRNGTALSSPIEFNLENARAKLETAIRRPNQAIGDEIENSSVLCYETGLISEKKSKDVASEKQKDPKKYCAVCGVTVALKICSGCKSISFCSREHQLEYWPKHKKECQRIRKRM